MKTALIFLFITGIALATPVLQMHKAFNALTDLVPYITQKELFLKKSNEKEITEKISEVRNAFRSAKHDGLLKQDLFAPSYLLVNENLDESLNAFKKGNKDYSHWRLKQLTSACIDCHTRLPTALSSSFEMGEVAINPSKYKNSYNLGIAQLIVRRYADAKASFTKNIDERIIKSDLKELIEPFKQILLIDAKVLKDPKDMGIFVEHYLGKKQTPEEIKVTLNKWKQRLKIWENRKKATASLTKDSEIKAFIRNYVAPLRKDSYLSEEYDVDALIISGIISNYLFNNPQTKIAPELNFWIGWAEKMLKRDNFFGSGDLFLKQCIQRYPSDPYAKECFKEYKESVEFEFSGSRGTDIPAEVQQELDRLEKMLVQKKK
jgi:hypothetical protein